MTEKALSKRQLYIAIFFIVTFPLCFFGCQQNTEQNDKPTEACTKAFDAIKEGDWSMVAPFDGMENLAAREQNRWERLDVNGDGLPELLSLCTDREGSILPIERIFAYTGGAEKTVTLVYTDLNDYTEYLFPTANGNLVYDYSNHGQIHYGSFTQYQFDENWEKIPLDRRKPDEGACHRRSLSGSLSPNDRL